MQQKMPMEDVRKARDELGIDADKANPRESLRRRNDTVAQESTIPDIGDIDEVEVIEICAGAGDQVGRMMR